MVTPDELREILVKWDINYTWYEIAKQWSETHRFYHDLDHLFDLLDQIDKRYPNTSKERDMLILTALFHDIIYNPARDDNETKSAKFFISKCKNVNDDIEDIYDMILDTKAHEGKSGLSSVFNDMDMSIVTKDLDTLLKWEEEIREEYSVYPDKMYKEGRIMFLNSLLEKYPQNKENSLSLISWVYKNY